MGFFNHLSVEIILMKHASLRDSMLANLGIFLLRTFKELSQLMYHIFMTMAWNLLYYPEIMSKWYCERFSLALFVHFGR